MRWRALVLAGSRGAEDPVAVAAGVKHKAFAVLAGKPMIDHVIAALGGVRAIDEIAVSIEQDAAALSEGLQRLDAASSPARSVLAAIERLDMPLLVTTADNPLLTPDVVNAFLADAASSKADIAAGVCLRARVEQAGNPARRTYLRFRDGEVSGCNLFALMRPRAHAAVAFWRALEVERKRPWRMASKIGFGTLLRYGFGQLDSARLAHNIGKAAGCSAALIRVDDIYAAHDVDKPDDLAFAERCLRARQSV